METHFVKDQSLAVNSVDSAKTLNGFSPNLSNEALESDEMGRDCDFLIEEDSRRVVENDSSPLDSKWAVVEDNGPSSSNWAEWPKPIVSNGPEWESQGDEETNPEISVLPFENHQSFKLGGGLANLGNTCFLNAVMQSFMHTVPLLQLLKANDHATPCDSYLSGFCLLCAIRELIDLSLASSGGVVSPWKLVNNLDYFSSSFHRYQQEDAHEFLQCFLDRLESCCNDSRTKEGAPSESDNIVKQAFGGRLVSKLFCCNCGHCSDTYEPIIDLSLEIEDADSLPTALESFTKVEKIDDPEIKFTCEKCKGQVSIEKQLVLDEAPSVAALHLKRFKNNGSFVEKIDKHVSFPLELDLLPYTDKSKINDEEMKYDLYAIIVHVGFSSCSGHYYSFIRSSPDEWYKCDDSEVVRVQEDYVLTQEAYILLYAKRGTPWFSDFIETQKPFIDPSMFNTSPKSVLDNMDAICIASPGVPNDHASHVYESKHAADDASPKPVLNMVGAESKATPQMSTPGPVSVKNSLDSHEVDNMSLPSVHNITGDGVTKRTVTLTPKTPSRSPSPEIYRDDSPENDYFIPRGHLTLTDHVSCKNRTQNDLEQDLERKQALTLIKKSIPGSRRQQLLMAAVRGSRSEGPVNKKRKKMEVSPIRDDRSSARRRKSSFDSGLRPVMAGSLR